MGDKNTVYCCMGKVVVENKVRLDGKSTDWHISAVCAFCPLQ